MAMYIITGKLGGGKSLSAMYKIFDYLSKGKRVATNIDLFPEFMLDYRNKGSITRIPDKPRLQDLQQMGSGDNKPTEEYDESTFGALVLDELGAVFNSRGKKDNERAELLNWFTNARKMHWDVYLIIHNIKMLDDQLRGILAEHVVSCKRMDRLTVPGLSYITKIFTGKPLNMPRLHLAIVKYGQSEKDPVVDRWWFRGSQFYKAYRTGQVFSDDYLFLENSEQPVDMRASYSVLSPWLVYGRYLPKSQPLYYRILNAIYKFVLKLAKERSGESAALKHTYDSPVSTLISTLCNEEKPLTFK